MAGSTSNGFVAKTLNEIIADVEVDLATIQDPVSGEYLQPDFSSDDPIMQIVQVPLEGISDAWAAQKLTSDQFDPSNATGVNLSGQVQLNGIKRQDESFSVSPITLTGTPSQPITGPISVSDELEVNTWTYADDVTLDVSGNATLSFTCETAGPITAEPATLTKIITPKAGLDSVTNGIQSSIGEDEETDPDLRARQRVSTSAPGSSVIEALLANLLNVNGVTFARCYQNLSPTVTDSRGVEPATLACVVVGGTDLDIATTIFTRYGAVQTQGNASVTFTDSQGIDYPIEFTRAEPVEIFVEIDIEVYNNATFPDDGEDQIAASVVAYSQEGAAAFGIEDGFEDGFYPGVTVEPSRLYTATNSVPGHRVTRLEVGLSAGVVSTSPIAIDFDKISAFTIANTTVTVL